MKQYRKHDVGIGEMNVYKVLSSAPVQAYNREFSTLLLPYAAEINTEKQTLTIPYYEGETYNHQWDVSDGGSSLGLTLINEVPLLIKDLSRIDINHFRHDPALANIPNLIFNYSEAKDYFYSLAVRLQRAGHLSTADLKAIKTILDYEQSTEMIVSNGDFYPRNFIKTPEGKVVLIDWEAWNDHSPFFIIDHPENVAAVQYVHMWGNSEWQAAFTVKLKRHFSFSEESFTKGVVIKSLTLATFFPEHKTLFQGQLQMMRRALNPATSYIL